MVIRGIDQVHPEAIKLFTDQEIGQNYYTLDEIKKMVEKSFYRERSASFALIEGDAVKGVRIVFPPGQWKKGKGQALSPHKWPHSQEETAYFQSLFIAKDRQRQGWGSTLSKKSLEVLKAMGAKGVVCHSWVESPGDSSRKYLSTLDFQRICTYPEYWKNVDYRCPRCGQPCSCTAEEMYLNLQGE